jgi:hypothetical protein
MEENLNSVNAEQVGTVDQPKTEQSQTTEQTVNADSGEAATPKVEGKVQQTPEENAKFKQIRMEYEAKIATESQRAAQKAKDDWIASQGYEWNGKPIKTEAEYNQAIIEKKYADKGIDPSLITEAINNNPVVKQAQEMMSKQQQSEARNAEYMEFLTNYPDVKPGKVTVSPSLVICDPVSIVHIFFATRSFCNVIKIFALISFGIAVTIAI